MTPSLKSWRYVGGEGGTTPTTGCHPPEVVFLPNECGATSPAVKACHQINDALYRSKWIHGWHTPKNHPSHETCLWSSDSKKKICWKVFLYKIWWKETRCSWFRRVAITSLGWFTLFTLALLGFFRRIVGGNFKWLVELRTSGSSFRIRPLDTSSVVLKCHL